MKNGSPMAMIVARKVSITQMARLNGSCPDGGIGTRAQLKPGFDCGFESRSGYVRGAASRGMARQGKAGGAW
jgi:hypothetical protein